jgi:hypothetical protein
LQSLSAYVIVPTGQRERKEGGIAKMSHYYEVQAARTQQDVENGQCDAVDVCDTKAEAVARARYLLTDEYQRVTEMSEPFGYVRVMRDGQVCVADRFRKVKQ